MTATSKETETTDIKTTVLHLQTTNRRGNFLRYHVDGTKPALSASQLVESLLGEVKARAGSIDSRDIDRRASRGISHGPARAAVGRVPDDVEHAADEGERGNIAERWEARRETVLAIGARNAVERAGLIVERSVERGAQRRRRVRLPWRIRGRVGRVGRRLLGRIRGCG